MGTGGDYLQWYTGPWPTRIDLNKEDDVLSKNANLVFEPVDKDQVVEMNSEWFHDLSLVKPEGCLRHNGDALLLLGIECATVAAVIQSYAAEVLSEEGSEQVARRMMLSQQPQNGSRLSAVCSTRV